MPNYLDEVELKQHSWSSNGSRETPKPIILNMMSYKKQKGASLNEFLHTGSFERQTSIITFFPHGVIQQLGMSPNGSQFLIGYISNHF